MTASLVSGAATEADGLAAVDVAGAGVPVAVLEVEAVFVAANAADSLPGALEVVFAPSMIGITDELVAAFCATAFIGVNTKQSNAVVGITIQELLVILPLCVKGFRFRRESSPFKSLWRLTRTKSMKIVPPVHRYHRGCLADPFKLAENRTPGWKVRCGCRLKSENCRQPLQICETFAIDWFTSAVRPGPDSNPVH
jgi:hypothetical protein